MSISTFLAKKFIWPKDSESLVKRLTIVSFASIFFAAFAISLAIMIMDGFQKAVKKNAQGFYADAMVYPDFEEGYLDVLNTLKDASVITDFCPVKFEQLIVETDKGMQPVYFQAVAAEKFIKTTELSKIINKNNVKATSFVEEINNGKVLIGKQLEKSLNIQESLVKVFYPKINGKKATFKEVKLNLGTSFTTGQPELDSNLILGSFSTLEKISNQKILSPSSVLMKIGLINSGQIKISNPLKKFYYLLFPEKLKDFIFQENLKIIKSIFKNNQVITWQELCPGLMQSLRLERLGLILILALLLLLAATSLVSMIFLKIRTKLRDIALLTTLGLKKSSLYATFFKITALIALPATLFGLLCSVLCGLWIEQSCWFKLPEIYLINSIPISCEIENLVIIFFAIVLTTIAAGQLPIFFLTKQEIFKMIKRG